MRGPRLLRSSVTYTMSSRNGLSSEERMPQIDGNAFVEHLGRHVECPMTLVVRGVVDEDIGNTERIRKRRNTRPQSIDVPNIRFCKPHARPFATQLCDKRFGRRFSDVNEADSGLLSHERAHDCRTDTRSATGYDH